MTFAHLKVRLVTAGVLILCGLASGIFSVYAPSTAWTMTGLAFIGVGMSSVEFSRMSSSEDRDWVGTTNFFLLLFLPGLILFGLAMRGTIQAVHPVFVKEFVLLNWGALLLCLAFALHSGRILLDRALVVLRDVFIGYLLVILGGCSVIYLTVVDDAPFILLWLLLVVCMNDAAAYFAGSKIGGVKIAPVISPNKTVAGCVAGLFVGTFVGVFCKGLLPGSEGPVNVLLFCAGIVVSAQLGDLLKSMVKRSYGVKDSGSVLPGHGGVLDRLDGVLMASPLLLAYCLLVS